MNRTFYWFSVPGAVFWCLRLVYSVNAGIAGALMISIELLLEFGILIIVPLLIGVLARPDRRGRWPRSLRLAAWLYLPAAFLAVVASPRAGLRFENEAGWLLSLPYLSFTILAAMFGLSRFLSRGRGLPGGFRIAETACDAGLVYIVVGGAWLVIDRSGWRPLDFPPVILLLTAVHFHFAACALPILAGLAGRRLYDSNPDGGGMIERVYPIIAGIVVAGPLPVAIGIAVSPALELVSALILALGVIGLALLQSIPFFSLTDFMRAGGRERGGALATWLSSTCLSSAMVFAMLFAWSEYSGTVIVALPAMVVPHGLANVLGVFSGVLAFVLRPAGSGLPAGGIPFSRLRVRGIGRIGSDFLRCAGLLVERSPAPRGLVGDLNVYRHGRLEPRAIDPIVRAFYERTGEFELLVLPDWRAGLRGPARLYKKFSSFMGQLNFPISAEGLEGKMDSRIEAIDDSADGRRDVRSWTRRFASTGRPLYVAIWHKDEREAYMNIAFPYIGGNLSSILRLEALPVANARPAGNGLLLTTLPRESRTNAAVGDEGVYFVTSLLPVRLPLDETIRVWPAGAGDCPVPVPGPAPRAEILARHDMWLFGARFLTLDYYIYRT